MSFCWKTFRSNPFAHRPEPGGSDWEDNWLSNGMAWFSDSFLKGWCDTGESDGDHDDHWTIPLTGYVWAECSCCLTLRSFALGVIFGAVFVQWLWVAQ